MFKLIDAIFGCSHANIGWPMTIKGVTTVVCFSCSKRLPYDLVRMTVGDPRPAEAPERAAVARG